MTPRRLTGPWVLFETTPMSATQAIDRLRETLAEQRSIERDPSVSSRRRLAGHVTEDQVWVRVDDANWITARKGWTVELSGRVEDVDGRAALSGVIDIPDRRALGQLIFLFQLIAAVLGLIAIAIAARAIAESGGLSIPAVLPIVVAGALIVGPAYLKREVELAAGEDAALLAESVHRILNSGD